MRKTDGQTQTKLKLESKLKVQSNYLKNIINAMKLMAEPVIFQLDQLAISVEAEYQFDSTRI